MSEPLEEAAPHDPRDDATLIDAVRRGDIAAYGVLYRRHLGAARRAAASVAATRAERDDLVSESFANVLRALRAGRGPVDLFRPYLLTTVRNSMIDLRRRDSILSFVAEVPEAAENTGREDVHAVLLHADVAAAAFARLPERWRTVLWYTEIEGLPPARVAPLLGLTPNGVAALAYRAREGLRQAYLDQYVPAAEQRSCQMAVGRLTAWIRRTLSPRKMDQVATHLDSCADCLDLVAELRNLNQQLPLPPRPIPVLRGLDGLV